MPEENESYQRQTRRRLKLNRIIINTIEKYNLNESDIAPPSPPIDNSKYDNAMDSIRAFEIEQISYSFKLHLPEDGELSDITTLQFQLDTPHNNDKGLSSEQIDIGVSEGFSYSTAQLPDSNTCIQSRKNSTRYSWGNSGGSLHE